MGFLDLFKPKWRHSDADVRVEAVRQLGPDDATILVQIVKKDADARVRRLAIKKLDDPEVLLDIAKSDADESLRRAAQERADELLLAAVIEAKDEAAARDPASKLGQKALLAAARRAGSGAVRQLAAALVNDERMLGEIARTSDDGALREVCLSRIKGEPVLRDVALGAPTKELALKALERILDPALLKDLAERGKGKALRAAALARTGAAPREKEQGGSKGGAAAAAAKDKRRRGALLSLVQKAEAIARGTDLPRAEAELDEVRGAWDELAEDEDAELRRRLDGTFVTLHERQVAQRRKAAESEKLAAAGRRDRERSDKRAALCERVEALDGEALPAQLIEARAAWSELGPVESEGERELGKRFARAIQDALVRHEQLDARRAARGQLEQLVIEIEDLVGTLGGEGVSINRAVSSHRGGMEARRAPPDEGGRERPPLIDGPDGREAGRRARALVARFQEQDRVLTASEELRARVEGAIALLKKAEEEERERRKKDQELLRERLSALCERLEGLAETSDPRRAEGALKEAHGAQRQIGELPLSERDALGARVRAARDRLVMRLEELREEEAWKRWANVPHAEALCQHVEALRDRLKEQEQKEEPAPEVSGELASQASQAAEVAEVAAVAAVAEAPASPEATGAAEATAQTDDEPQARRARRGPSLQKELQAARVAWKALGPLPKEKSEILWQRFQAACDELSGHVRAKAAVAAEGHAENQKRKEELCQQAEALAESTDWKEAAEQLKRLQTEWKEAGPVATRAEADALWKRFRGACDRFFDRRKAHGEQGDKERAENAVRLSALCQKAEALAGSTDWKEAAEALKNLQAEWKEIGPAPRADSEALWKQFRGACDRFFDRRKEHFEKVDAERGENLKGKEALCLEVEQLFDSEEMGEQEAQEAVREYMTKWKAVGPVPKEQSEPVWERFRHACDRLMLRQWLPPDLEPVRFENRPLSGLGQRLSPTPGEGDKEGGD